MAAGAVGTVWAEGSWSDTAWEANTWADAVPGPPSALLLVGEVNDITPLVHAFFYVATPFVEAITPAVFAAVPDTTPLVIEEPA